jgi:Conjugative transposon protein TcpC
MVRGPKSGDGAWSSVHYLDSAGLAPPRAQYTEMDPLDAGMAGDGSLAAGRGIGGGPGAGGRWLLWPLRVVLWTALLVVAFRGLTAIALDRGPAAPDSGTRAVSAAGSQFPVSMAEAFAAEFGRVYLSASPQNQGLREQALAAFVPSGVSAANPDLGWNGVGLLNLQAEQVAGITVQDPRHAVVTLLAMVNGQLMELGVPVAVSGTGVVVSGEPAWLPAPPQAPLPATPPGGSDPVAQSQLMTELPAFFQAYANGDGAALSRFAAHGVSLTGLGGAVAFDSIASLHVPPGGAMRQITVTVIWQVPSQGSAGIAKIAMSYRVSVLALQSGKWYVNEISASTEAVGGK